MDVLSHVLGIPKIGGGGVAAPAITTLSIPDAGVGIAYSQQIEATGTVQTWTLLVQDYDDTDITDDCGLEIDENGLLAGTPVIPTGASGLWTVTVTAQNAGGSDEASFEIEVWVLRVDFSDDKAAPVGTYAGEFGSVSVDDSGNNVLVESGVLKWTNVVGANDPRVQSSEITRRNGRVFITHVALHNQRTTHVIRNAASSIIIGLEPFGANFNIQSVFIPVPIGFNGAEFITALVVHDGWIDAWVKHSGTWRRLFVVQTTTPTDIIYAYATINTNGGRQVAAMRVIDAPAPLDVILSDALVNVTPAVTDTEYNAAADLVLDLALTSPSDLTDAEAGIRFRKSSDNYWELKIDSSGNLVLERFASGVGQGATTLATGVISTSQTRTLRSLLIGTHMAFQTGSLSGAVMTWTQRGAAQTDSVLGANTIVQPFANAAWMATGSLGQLRAAPRTNSAIAAILDRMTA